MSITPIGGVSSGVLGGAPAVGQTQAVGGTSGFGDAVSKAVGSVEEAQSQADGFAQLAATGRLDDVHQYTVAAARAQIVTELAVAVRNKAVEGFNEIMRMPL